MEFAELDDGLFLEERQRGSVAEEYSARFCENEWFLEAVPNQLVSREDKLSVQKHSAEYFFLKEDYKNALVEYDDILSTLSTSNTVLKRECYEGIARSYIKLNMTMKAVEFAEKLHATSKNADHTTVSLSVLVDSYLAAGRFTDAVTVCQTLLTCHPCNCDLWIKLGFIYAQIFSIMLPNVQTLVTAHLPVEGKLPVKDFQCMQTCQVTGDKLSKYSKSCEEVTKRTDLNFENSLDSSKKCCSNTVYSNICVNVNDKMQGSQLVAACLQRAYNCLKKTEGTAVGFALEFSKLTQNKILLDQSNLLDEESLCELRNHVHQNDVPYTKSSLLSSEETSEFVDRGSSKFKASTTDMKVELVSQDTFEETWFMWMR